MYATPGPRPSKRTSKVTRDLVRISAGIEDIDDLIWDLDQAITASQK